MLSVSEHFYSLQGEGPSMGRPSVFLRLRSCNMLCGGIGTVQDKQLHDRATWRCDTIEVWLKGEKKDYPDVLTSFELMKIKEGAHLIITGGEPLLQQGEIVNYITWLRTTLGIIPYVEIETNGTIQPVPYLVQAVAQWNCSPKLINSGVPLHTRLRPTVLKFLSNLPGSIFKFVITEEDDWDEIEQLLTLIDKKKVWLMPGASTIEELLARNKMVSQIALINNVNFSSRLQVEIWNQTTGV